MTSKSFPHKEKKKETFHAEIITAGWTNIKPLRENRSCVCVCVCDIKTCVTFNKQVCRFGRTCIYLVGFFQHEQHCEILGYMGGAVCLVSHRVQNENQKSKPETQTCWKWHKPQRRDQNRGRSWNDIGCTLYKTRTNSHPDRCEDRKKKPKTSEISVSSFTMMEAILTELQLIYM